MLFHVGVLWRLVELAWLARLDLVCSVSGGSITAGALARNWVTITRAADPVDSLNTHIVEPLRALAGTTIDIRAAARGLLPGGNASRCVAAALDNYVFAGTHLADLPERPEFIFQATNVSTGKLVRFSKRRLADWRVGEARNPNLALSTAVAASAAFPPFLSPHRLNVSELTWRKGELSHPRFRKTMFLTDGGVYDNLGLQVARRECGILQVSDGGGSLQANPLPTSGWGRHTKRVLELLDHQVRSLRLQQIKADLRTGGKAGAFINVRGDYSRFSVPDLLPFPEQHARRAAALPTRFKALRPHIQEELINWGYAIADANIRADLDQAAAAPTRLPFSHDLPRP